MKIVLFDYVFEQGRVGTSGLSDVVWELAQALTDMGEEVHIVGPYPESTPGPSGVILHRYALPPINYRNVIGHLWIIVKGWQTIRREIPDADIVHTPEYLSTALFSLRSRVPVILTTPGNIYERVHSGSNPFDASMSGALKIAARISARRCAGINAISNDMRYWWEYSGASPEKIVVSPYGVKNSFHPILDAREKLEWSGDQKHLLFVGRLSKEKGVDLLIQAFGQLAATRPDLQLHVIGDGKERESCSALAASLGCSASVKFYGWIDKYDLPLYYSASDICVVPSRTEPLGRIILEAMACKTFVIGAKVGGIPDLIKEGRTGLLFESDNLEDLKDKLEWAVSNPAAVERMADEACEFIEQNQTWGKVAERLRDELYRPAIDGAHA
jgi:glycosyltransferase involved in cell wall biosynthesis